MHDVKEPTLPLVTTSSATPQVTAPTQITIHSIDFDSDEDNHDEEDDEELNIAVSQGEDDQEFVTLSSLPSFDDVPTSMIESSILDFTEVMSQMSQDQKSMSIPNITITTEIPPLVTTTLVTTTLAQISQVAKITSTSQRTSQVPMSTQVETTTPPPRSNFPSWLEIVAPNRKTQAISLDEFDFG